MNKKASRFLEEVLDESRIQDLKLAASKIPVGPERRSFQAEIALKYLGGKPRRTEEIFRPVRTIPSLDVVQGGCEDDSMKKYGI